jgi:hypothetical protein
MNPLSNAEWPPVYTFLALQVWEVVQHVECFSCKLAGQLLARLLSIESYQKSIDVEEGKELVL